MGAITPKHQSLTVKPTVAFDFDGTLTVKDSFSAFVAWYAGPVRGALGGLRMVPELLAYIAFRDRGRLKAAAVGQFLAGLDPQQLAEAVERFAAGHADKLLRPDALRTWRAWQDKGALMVIVTASPEAVVEPFARRLGADRLIGTRLAVDDMGRISGPLDGANCRGQEKVRRLQAEFGPDLRLAAAYGDTSGDREMLALADEQGYRVFKGRP